MGQSVNSLDYEEISRETFGSLQRSSLFVRSIEAELDGYGLPKAVWQFGDQSLNIYSEHSPSEMGFKTSQAPLKKYYVTQTGSQLSLNTSFCDTEFSGADFDSEQHSRHLSRERSPQPPPPTKTVPSGVASVFHTPSHTVTTEKFPVVPEMETYSSGRVLNDIYPIREEYAPELEFEEEYVVPFVKQSASLRNQPPTLPRRPPNYESGKKKKTSRSRQPSGKPTGKSFRPTFSKPRRYQPTIPKEYRLEPTADDSFYNIQGEYVPEFYHSQLWEKPRKKKLQINNEELDESEVVEPNVPPKEMNTIAIQSRLGDESIKELEHQQRQLARQNLKTLLKNQNVLSSELSKSGEQREEAVESNAKTLSELVQRQKHFQRLLEEKRRREENRKRQEKRKKQRKREAELREKISKLQKEHNSKQERDEYVDESEFKARLEHFRRLAEEKTRLSLTKSHDSQSQQSANSTAVVAGHPPDVQAVQAAVTVEPIHEIIEERSIESHSVGNAHQPIAPPRHINSAIEPNLEPSLEMCRPKKSYSTDKSSERSSKNSKNQRTEIPTINGDGNVEVLSYRKLPENGNKSGSWQARITEILSDTDSEESDEENTPNRSSGDKPVMMNNAIHYQSAKPQKTPPKVEQSNDAGVQTGRPSIMAKGNIRLPRESLNLSDLSDEEVDRRLTRQLSLMAKEHGYPEYPVSRNPSSTSGTPIQKENEGFQTVFRPRVKPSSIFLISL